MSLEQQRKENRRELAQRDEELEDARCSAHKKVKGKRANMLLHFFFLYIFAPCLLNMKISLLTL